MRKLGTTMMATMLAVGLAGCDTDPVTPGQGETATMQVVMHGDLQSTGQSTSAADAPQHSTSSATGNVDVRARVWVQTQAGAWTELTNGAAARQTVSAASGAEGRVLLTTSAVAQSYTRVRVEFQEVRAQVTGGLTIGAGLVQGEIRVGGSGSTTVEREVRFTANSGSTTQLVIDLNAQTWLRRADATTRVVGEADFRNAVAITAR